MRRLSVIICLILAAFIVKSKDLDNLKPDASTLTDFDYSSAYKAAIKKRLLAGLCEFPVARTIVCPSFEPEFVVSIEPQKNKNGDGYDHSKTYLILRTCNPSIWSTYSNNDSSIIVTKEILIDSVFSQSVERLFKTALSEAKFSLIPTSGLDGTNYHFISTVMFEGVHSGYAWSPDSTTKMGELCQISELLRDYCETNDERIRDQILKKSNKLIGRFGDTSTTKRQVNIERYLWISLSSLLIIAMIFLIVKVKNGRQ